MLKKGIPRESGRGPPLLWIKSRGRHGLKNGHPYRIDFFRCGFFMDRMMNRFGVVFFVCMLCVSGPGRGETFGSPSTLSPRSVIALAPSITEIVFSLGRGELLSGVTLYSDHPKEARKLPRVGSYVRPDIEKVVALKPDLVIAVKDGNPEDLTHRLSLFGIPVHIVDPHDLESVMDTVADIGRLLGARDRADQVIGDMRRRIAAVKSRVAKTGDRPGVFFQIGVAPIVSIGSSTFIDELIRVCGGRNLAAGSVSYPRYSEEQVIAANPDVLLISSMARQESFVKVKRRWETWSGISAVQKGRIHIVDSDILDRPTPRMVEGLETLMKLIHPELGEK